MSTMLMPTKTMLLLLVFGAITLSGCLKNLVQQGNVIPNKTVATIAVGDTRFRVESLLGTPVLKSALHPNRAIYVESYEDEATGALNNRHITINYDQSLRVESIDRRAMGAASSAAP
ncbi:MAG: outer membrane protein assembly factor BamE [Mariprofundales bacterium]